MRRLVPLLLGLLLVPSVLEAQTSADVPAPPLLPNYERQPVGEREALEAGAYIARSDDANANWYNPAGLAQVDRTSANLSANAYEATTLQIASLRQKTSTLRLTPLAAFFGIAVGDPLTTSKNVRYGFYIASPISWETGNIEQATSPNPGSLSAVSSEASLYRLEPGVSVGVRMNDHFRLGGSLGVSVTTLSLSQDIFVRVADADSATTTRRRLAMGAESWHVVPRLGMQWDVTKRMSAGLTATAPGLQMFGFSRVSLNAGNYTTTDRYSDLTFRDDNASFEYRLPFTVAAGIAWKYAHGSIEGTVHYYGSTGDYEMVSTQVEATRVDANGVATPTLTSVSVSPISNRWRDVTNVALGGNYAFTDAFRIHFGINSDRSPVDDPQTSVFRKVELMGGTLGLSYQAKLFGTTLGLGYSAGQSGPLLATGGIAKTEDETRLKISTVRAMYSFSAKF